MKHLLLTISLTLSTSFSAFAQLATFDVVMAGHTIGSVKVLQHDGAERLLRKRIEAEFSVPFYTGSFVSENRFENGALHSSSTEQIVNGKRREHTVTTRVASQHYRFDLAEKSAPASKRDIAEPIAYTITGLYYQEPTQVQAVYSEKFGAMCRIRKIENGSYVVQLPNGKESVYSYRDGECVRIVTELGGVRLSIVRKQRNL
ncbi:hypothetical protein SAMN04487996_11660 [Dyadobacter soli]|uniref:Uncharacterized protein n=1 Tax=Dyadobacter soli TaxID=659014 RepID=A0A1G7SBP2_9BACT|nr:DUF6134 family protein [Dyadobacter soli]SDG20413.1 hypothetical protein SAMN04487996_11660 [Dyadobacter soli]